QLLEAERHLEAAGADVQRAVHLDVGEDVAPRLRVAHLAFHLEADAVEQHALDADALPRQREPILEAERDRVGIGFIAHQVIALQPGINLDLRSLTKQKNKPIIPNRTNLLYKH